MKIFSKTCQNELLNVGVNRLEKLFETGSQSWLNHISWKEFKGFLKTHHSFPLNIFFFIVQEFSELKHYISETNGRTNKENNLLHVIGFL